MDVMPINIASVNAGCSPNQVASPLQQGAVGFGMQGDFSSLFQQLTMPLAEVGLSPVLLTGSEPVELPLLGEGDIASSTDDGEAPAPDVSPEEMAAIQALLNPTFATLPTPSQQFPDPSLQGPLDTAITDVTSQPASLNLQIPVDLVAPQPANPILNGNTELPKFDGEPSLVLNAQEWDFSVSNLDVALPQDPSKLADLSEDLSLLDRQLQADPGQTPQLTPAQGLESLRHILAPYLPTEESTTAMTTTAESTTVVSTTVDPSTAESLVNLETPVLVGNTQLATKTENQPDAGDTEITPVDAEKTNPILTKIVNLLHALRASLNSETRQQNSNEPKLDRQENHHKTNSTDADLTSALDTPIEIDLPVVPKVEDPVPLVNTTHENSTAIKSIVGVEDSTAVRHAGTNNESVLLTKDNGRVVFEQPVVPTPSSNMAERMEQHQALRQVAQKVQWLMQSGESRAVLRLDPPELGHIELEVHSKPGELKVHMTVESESVKQVMESSIGSLRTAMEQQNVKLEKLEVQVDQGRSEAQTAQRDPSQSGHRKSSKGGRGTGIAEGILESSTSDTGRRFGYNTMELIA